MRLTAARRAILLVAILLAVPSGALRAQSNLEVLPANPTSEESLHLLVHGDANGDFCGRLLAISPEPLEPGFIDVWFVTLDFSVGCPAAFDPVTVDLPLGTLAPGEHTIRLWQEAYPDEPAAVRASLAFTVTEGPSTRLALHGSRFEARVSWRSFDGSSGAGTVVPGSSAEGGLFWFFSRGNWELLLKVLNGCDLNGRFWVLGAGATTVGFTVEIVDTRTQETWTHTNALGHDAGSFFDTSAFADACAPPPPAP